MKYHTFIVSNLSQRNASQELRKAFKGYNIYSARTSTGFAHRVPCAMVTLVGDFDPKEVENALLTNAQGQKLTIEFLTTQVREESTCQTSSATSSPFICRLK